MVDSKKNTKIWLLKPYTAIHRHLFKLNFSRPSPEQESCTVIFQLALLAGAAVVLVASAAGAATSFLLGHISLQNGLPVGISSSAFVRIASHNVVRVSFLRVSRIGKFWPRNSCLAPEEAENLPAHLTRVLPAPSPGYKDEHLFSPCFPSCGHGQGNPASTHEIFYMNFVFLTFSSN